MLVIFAAVLLAAWPAAAQDEEEEPPPPMPLELAGAFGGEIGAWVIQGQRLYLAQGASLRVFDIQDPARPRQLQWFALPGLNDGITLRDAMLWVPTVGFHSPRNEQGCACFSVGADGNLQPTQCPPLSEEEAAEAAMAEPAENAVQSSAGAKPLTELEQAERKALVQCAAGPLQNVHAVLAAGPLAWVRAGADYNDAGRWYAVDVTHAAAPVVLGEVSLPGGDHPLVLYGSRVLGAGEQPGLRVYDAVSSGVCPLVGELALPSKVEAISLEGTRAALALGSHGAGLVDLTMPAAPRLIATLPVDGVCDSVALSGQQLAARGDSLIQWEITDPQRPVPEGSLWVSSKMTTDVTQLETAPRNEGDLIAWSMARGMLVVIWKDENGYGSQSFLHLRADAKPSILRESEYGYYDRPSRVITDQHMIAIQSFAHNTQLNMHYITFYDMREEPPKSLGVWEGSNEISDFVRDGERLYVADGNNGLQIMLPKPGTQPWGAPAESPAVQMESIQ